MNPSSPLLRDTFALKTIRILVPLFLLAAISQPDHSVYVGWRLFGTDPDDIAFNLYRISNNAQPVKLNSKPTARMKLSTKP